MPLACPARRTCADRTESPDRLHRGTARAWSISTAIAAPADQALAASLGRAARAWSGARRRPAPCQGPASGHILDGDWGFQVMELLERTSFLHTLAEYAGAARLGDGRLVLVSGESGIGKTALVETF